MNYEKTIFNKEHTKKCKDFSAKKIYNHNALNWKLSQ